MKEGGDTNEDVVQARTCLAWLHWITNEPAKVVEGLQGDYVGLLQQEAGKAPANPSWTDMCLLKAAYMKGSSLIQLDRPSEALREWQPVPSWLESFGEKIYSSPQFSYWTEQLLAQAAVSLAQIFAAGDSSGETVHSALQFFRKWSAFSGRGKEASPTSFGNSSAHLSRLSVWKADYTFVSAVLRRGIPYPTEINGSPRVAQASELKRVEAMYENALLQSTRFPHASQSNTVIEDWVEEAVQNWQIMCGDLWRDTDLGEGGRNECGRNMLEILYRAAAKTFHSTLILRRLFQVHKSLADFDLAYEALATYVELIERGRARAAKSREPAIGQDDEETVLRTMSEGIEALCAFGGKDEAEKAYELSKKLQNWLDQLPPDSEKGVVVNGHTDGHAQEISDYKSIISPASREAVLRALGIANAHWALWTPFTETRTSLQASAITRLQQATAQNASDDYHLRSSYALALVLAQTRDIEGAIDCIKRPLIAYDVSTHDQSYASERKLTALWHLLGLLLTAHQDFTTASQACSAAFEQLPSTDTLFGSSSSNMVNTKVPEDSVTQENSAKALVDDMECDELQRLMEIRITELALIEVQDGPETAVNHSTYLLSQYVRLFKRFGVGVGQNATPKTLDPPQSSATTVKSLRGSLFGRKKPSRISEDTVTRRGGQHGSSEKGHLRPSTRGTDAPTIHVTDEDEKSQTHKHHIFRRSEDRQSNASKQSPRTNRKHGSLSKVFHPASQEKPFENINTPASSSLRPPTTQSEQNTSQGAFRSEAAENAADNPLRPQHTTDEVPAPPTSLTSLSSPEATKGAPATEELDQAHAREASEKIQPGVNNRLAQNSGAERSRTAGSVYWKTPIPRFPKSTQQKHSLAVLCKIWLTIAMLYRRAHMFDDAREACDEATKCVQRVESIVATTESSARAFAARGWGGSGQSSDELWADVFCEKGQLALAIASFEQERNKGKVRIDSEKVQEAVEHFEQCLMSYPDHAKGIVALSNVLLDFYEKKLDLGRRIEDGKPKEELKDQTKEKKSPAVQNGAVLEPGSVTTQSVARIAPLQTDDELKKTPENLNRLAARDRAYGLLSALTKLGTGWDDSEAWFTLGRAHELGGEMDRAKEVWWWCVELEDRRPLRHWRNVCCTGYVL